MKFRKGCGLDVAKNGFHKQIITATQKRPYNTPTCLGYPILLSSRNEEIVGAFIEPLQQHLLKIHNSITHMCRTNTSLRWCINFVFSSHAATLNRPV